MLDANRDGVINTEDELNIKRKVDWQKWFPRSPWSHCRIGISSSANLVIILTNLIYLTWLLFQQFTNLHMLNVKMILCEYTPAKTLEPLVSHEPLWRASDYQSSLETTRPYNRAAVRSTRYHSQKVEPLYGHPNLIRDVMFSHLILCPSKGIQ